METAQRQCLAERRAGVGTVADEGVCWSALRLNSQRSTSWAPSTVSMRPSVGVSTSEVQLIQQRRASAG